MACIEATGMTVTLTGATTFFAEITDFDGPNMSRNSIDCTHMGSSHMTFKPASLPDYGDFNVTMHFDPAQQPPIDSAAAQCTVTFPDDDSAGTADWVFTGFLTNFSPSGTVNDKMTATATLKITGVLVVDGTSV